MNTLVLQVICAILFGTYDLSIKLASGSGNPTALAFLVQLASAITLAFILLRQSFSEPLKYPTSPLFAIAAGVLIAIALSLLFFILKNGGLPSSSVIPFTLIGRNLILVILSVIFLKDNLSSTRLLGLTLGFISLFLINR